MLQSRLARGRQPLPGPLGNFRSLKTSSHRNAGRATKCFYLKNLRALRPS